MASADGAVDYAAMSRSMIQRRLLDVSERLRKVRAELQVNEEQVLYLEEEADEARLRAIVSETPLAAREEREARRHAETLARHRDDLRQAIEELEAERDALLDRMSAELAEQ